MKKRIVLLPLLMLVLAACGPTGTDTSPEDTSSGTNTPTDTSTPSDTSSTTDTSTDPIDEVQSIADVRALVSEGTVVIEGNVIALNKKGFVLGDETGFFLVYLNAVPSQIVGDYVRVAGTTSSYQGARQITNSPAPVITAGEGTNPNITLGLAEEMTSAEWDAFDMSSDVPTFITGLAKVFQSGSYYNFNFTGLEDETAASLPGALAYPIDEVNFAVLDNVGKSYEFEGILVGTSASSGVNVRQNVIVTSATLVEEQEPQLWDGVLPDGYSSITTILADATVDKVFKTRSVVVNINGGQVFLQDADGASILAYKSGAGDTLLVGNVVDVEGQYKTVNLAPELAGTITITKVFDGKTTAIEPVAIISDGAVLTAKLGTNYSISGQFVRINGVTASAYASNKFTITLGTVSVQVTVGYSALHEAAGEGRTAMSTLIGTLNTSSTVFDIIGVVYSATSAGVWNVGICTTDYIVVPS